MKRSVSGFIRYRDNPPVPLIHLGNYRRRRRRRSLTLHVRSARNSEQKTSTPRRWSHAEEVKHATVKRENLQNFDRSRIGF